MYSLTRHGTWRALFTEEGPALLLALGVAELFFKFHSFILEGLSFLVVWYVLGAASAAFRRTLAARQE